MSGTPEGAVGPGATSRPGELRALALLFLRLGATAFGGPAAHIAIMEEEVVRRRRWLTRAEFIDMLGAANLIPGPNSTEMAIHIGHRRAGWPGLVVAGACFILPAAFLVAAIAWAYVRWGRLPEAAGLLAGVKPVVVAVVLQALVGFGRSAIRTVPLGIVAAAAALAAALGGDELAVLLGAGIAMGAVRLAARRKGTAAALLPPAALGALLPAAGAAAAGYTAAGLFLVFLKIGSVLYGSGYVLLAFLRSELVHRLGWLTEAQLLDAVAVGQVTPGPVFTTATFVGWVLGGATGATVATLGIFLPAFVFVAISGPLVPRIRASPVAGAFLDGVNVASLALMAVVTVELARAAVTGWATAALAAVSAVLLLRYRVSSTWVILGGAVLGVALLGR